MGKSLEEEVQMGAGKQALGAEKVEAVANPVVVEVGEPYLTKVVQAPPTVKGGLSKRV